MMPGGGPLTILKVLKLLVHCISARPSKHRNHLKIVKEKTQKPHEGVQSSGVTQGQRHCVQGNVQIRHSRTMLESDDHCAGRWFVVLHRPQDLWVCDRWSA